MSSSSFPQGTLPVSPSPLSQVLFGNDPDILSIESGDHEAVFNRLYADFLEKEREGSFEDPLDRAFAHRVIIEQLIGRGDLGPANDTFIEAEQNGVWNPDAPLFGDRCQNQRNAASRALEAARNNQSLEEADFKSQ